MWLVHGAYQPVVDFGQGMVKPDSYSKDSGPFQQYSDIFVSNTFKAGQQHCAC